jgi:DNA-binding transcriptional LysR family regulator
LDYLVKGQVDFGIVDGRIDHPDIESILILKDKISLIVPAKHPLTKHPRISSQSLLEQPVIIREEGSEIRDVTIKSLYEHRISIDMLHIVLIIDNSEAILRAVEKGIGIAFLPQATASEAIKSGRVVEIEISGLTLERELFAVRNRKQPLPRTQIELWDYILNLQTKDTIASE